VEEMGFIAQEVEDVLPDTVSKDPSTGMMSLKFDHFTPLLVESVKEQQEVIQQQTVVLEKLHAMSAQHERDIDDLRARLDACGCS